jgi:hypothetical protein
MTTQPEHTIESRLTKLFNFSKPVKLTKKMHRYHVEVDDDTHWELVRIAAKQKLYQEDFVEQLLVEFVAEHCAAMAVRKGIEIDESEKNESTKPVWAPWAPIEPISFNDQLPGDKDVDEDGCCWIWNKQKYFWDLAYIRTKAKDFLPGCTYWLPYTAISFPGEKS